MALRAYALLGKNKTNKTKTVQLMTGAQTNINQQLEHITCMPFCMHLSCHCRETDFCLFMTWVSKPRSLILGTVNTCLGT